MLSTKVANPLRIGIVGGSIAGLTAGLMLKKLGHEVTILERSKEGLKGRGAGIGMPSDLVAQCKALGLLDENFPALTMGKNIFVRSSDEGASLGETFWERPLPIVAVNWVDLFNNLKKRFPQANYLGGERLESVDLLDADKVGLSTANGGRIFSEFRMFDWIIAADGIGSAVRKQLCPESQPKYAGYVAWRGLVDMSEVECAEFFEGHAPCVMFPGGQLLLYPIPAPDYNETGRVQLNWVMYEQKQAKEVSAIMTDKQGITRNLSVPMGELSETSREQLVALAHRVLPSAFAKIVAHTKEPFVQVIYDGVLPKHVLGRCIFLGDAAAVLRPHTASGALKAIQGAISLSEVFSKYPDDKKGLAVALNGWGQAQGDGALKQSTLAQTFGRALVTDAPDWKTMTPESMTSWFAGLMAGHQWYGNSASNGSASKAAEVSAESRKIYSPLRDARAETGSSESQQAAKEANKDLAATKFAAKRL